MQVAAFVRSVFVWMCAGLFLTAGASAWVAVSPAGQNFIFRPGIIPLLVIIEVTTAFGLSSAVARLRPVVAAVLFVVFSLLNGVTLSGIALVYTDTEIFEAFMVAAGMFGATALYGLRSKKDLTSPRSLALMALIGVAIAMAFNLVTHAPVSMFGIAVAVVVLFLALTARDSSKLKALASERDPAVVGALALYLDLLRIFGRRDHLEFGRR